MRHYDDYDLEQAYDEQADKLQEWEIEKLVSQQGLSCLYRTTTNRAKLSLIHISEPTRPY